MQTLDFSVERIFLGSMFSLFRPPPRLSTREYAEEFRWLSSEVAAEQGRMDCMKTPYMLKVMQAMDDVDIKVIVARKSAQIAWSETQNNFVARTIDLDPRPMIMAFPREKSGKDYSNEKLKPLIKDTPRLLELIGDPDKQPAMSFKFPGGFLKLVTAGSVTALKSTPAPILIVEEPDDLKEDLKGQGDALTIFMERQKTYEDSKLIYGGTPSEKGFSKVDEAFESSNKMFFQVICHACGQFHALSFDNLRYDPYPDNKISKIYGKYDYRTARYHCPHCDTIWTDKQKNLNVRESVKYHDLGWKATAESDILGFAFNELMSPFPGSTFESLVKKLLVAKRELEKGKEGKMKAFVNNSMGEAYSPKSMDLDLEAWKARRLAYPEGVVPVGGIVLTAGIDVQHNRFAIIVRAWGRNGNSWLVYWGELFGFVKDPEDAVWEELTNFVLGSFCYADKYMDKEIRLPISAVSIDSGDGLTAQLVYSWVLRMATLKGPKVFATKGSSELGASTKEIFTVPSQVEATTKQNQRKALAERMGVTVYIVGTQTAKDEVLRKLSLTGTKDRSYHYETVREDYEEQVLSNVKRLSPKGDATRYELIAGRNDEALDGEVLALHSKHALGLHLWREQHWQQAERGLIAALLPPKPKPLYPEPDDNVTPGIN